MRSLRGFGLASSPLVSKGVNVRWIRHGKMPNVCRLGELGLAMGRGYRAKTERWAWLGCTFGQLMQR